MESIEKYTFTFLHGRIVLKGKLGSALVSALLLDMLSVAVNPTHRLDINCFWALLAATLIFATLLVLMLHGEFKKIMGVALYASVFTAILFFTTWSLGGFIAIAVALFVLNITIEIEAHDLDTPQPNG